MNLRGKRTESNGDDARVNESAVRGPNANMPIAYRDLRQ